MFSLRYALHLPVSPLKSSDSLPDGEESPEDFHRNRNLSLHLVVMTTADRQNGKEGRVEHPSLGEQEMEVLGFVTERQPVTAGEVAEAFAESHGLARTTVLTVMERLRKKGYLVRGRRSGIFYYSPRLSQSEVLQGQVSRFVETTLHGSLAPVVAYLSRSRRLSDEEVAELDRLVEELKREQEDRS